MARSFVAAAAPISDAARQRQVTTASISGDLAWPPDCDVTTSRIDFAVQLQRFLAN
jgi:hypothetical protein